MAHNSHVRGSDLAADWSLGSTVTSAEFAALANTGVFQSINGDLGGTWAPAATLIIGGAGVTLSGTNSFSGATTIGGALTASNVSSLTMSGTNKVSLASRSITRFMPGNAFCSTSGWSIGVTNLWSNSGDTAKMTATMVLPHGQTLDTVTLRYKGASGHAAFPGGKPANMPTIKLFRVDTTGAVTQVGSTATDSSATAGAFEGVHDISITTIGHSIDNSVNRYFLEITAEGSTNYIAGDAWYVIAASCTVTNMAEWA